LLLNFVPKFGLLRIKKDLESLAKKGVTLERSDLHPAEALAERQRFCGNGIESYKKLRSLEQLVDNEYATGRVQKM
jgi:hypothetical protein